jgi:hypothetical protein
MRRFVRRWTMGGRWIAARAAILTVAFVLGLVAA